MKHWDDMDELPAGSFSTDPTIWALGQITGLREALRMLSERAAGSNYQSLDKFSHFADRNCYQCHHKLVDDALRQARGHYLMVDAVLTGVAAGRRDELAGLWNGVVAAASSSPAAAKQKSDALIGWLGSLEGQVGRVDQEATRRMLNRVTAGGDRAKLAERFGFSRSKTSNVVDVDQLEHAVVVDDRRSRAVVSRHPGALPSGRRRPLRRGEERHAHDARRDRPLRLQARPVRGEPRGGGRQAQVGRRQKRGDRPASGPIPSFSERSADHGTTNTDSRWISAPGPGKPAEMSMAPPFMGTQ